MTSSDALIMLNTDMIQAGFVCSFWQFGAFFKGTKVTRRHWTYANGGHLLFSAGRI